ncbi:MAG: hypothetical protein ACD_20C00358G0009 [uncultured bacterium]|nr:MAG: hypothetical protein ACD_20C00358G0009 [uncultured bacterium]HBH19295.1 hypothetical protein [Cyanobacteria bacterium UBA9579]
MLLCILSILISVLTGFLLVLLLWPEQKTIFSNFLLKLSLAVGLGFGGSSCLFFFWKITGLSFKWHVIAEIFLVIFLFYLFKKRDPADNSEILPISNADKSFCHKIFQAGFWIMLSLSTTFFIQISLQFPHGERDAFTIWNAHAKFLFSNKYWMDGFTNDMLWFHPDYPLLLPGIIAKFWNYIGHESVIIPVIIAFFFTFATVALLFSSISIFRGKGQGFLAASLLLGIPLFIKYGASQCADVPIGFFILATIVLLSLNKNNYKLLILAGIMAGFAGWMKNEGLLFIFSTVIAYFVVTLLKKGWKTSIKQLLFFISGILPVLAVIVYFKIQFAPPSDIFLFQNPEQIIMKLTDFSRYFVTLSAFIGAICSMGGFIAPILLLIYPFLMGTKISIETKSSILLAFVIMFLILTGYFFIYIITPYDLNWHIKTSINRLFVQLYPAFIFLYFMIVRSPEDIS